MVTVICHQLMFLPISSGVSVVTYMTNDITVSTITIQTVMEYRHGIATPLRLDDAIRKCPIPKTIATILAPQTLFRTT